LRDWRRRRGGLLSADQPELPAQVGVHFLEYVRILAQELLGVFPALADALAFVAVPGAALLDQVVLHSQVDQIAFPGNAFAIDDVELSFAERRSHLVLDDLDLGAIADHRFAFFDRGDAADVGADAGVELEGAPAGGGFGIPEHHADFSRIWLMKIRQVFDLETMPVSLRMACDIRRECTPMKL